MSARNGRSARTPLFVDALALAQELLERFEGASGPLETRLVALALDLLETLTLALKDRDREAQIERADELLLRQRVLLRVAAEAGRLMPEPYAQVLERVDVIGRQLGGWRRSIGPV